MIIKESGTLKAANPTSYQKMKRSSCRTGVREEADALYVEKKVIIRF